MNPAYLLAFAFALFVWTITPGPVVVSSVSKALTTGFRSSVWVITGAIVEDLLCLALAVGGVAAAALALGELFFVVKLIGAGYLIWLGVRLWRAEAGPMESSTGSHVSGHRSLFLLGFLASLGSPDTIVFYVTFLPSLISLEQLAVFDVAVLAALVAGIPAVSLAFFSYSAAGLRGCLTSRRARRNLNRGAGTVMIGTGVAVATR